MVGRRSAKCIVPSALTVVLIAIAPALVRAADTTTQQAFDAGDWNTVVELYEESPPPLRKDAAEEWFRYGYSLYRLERDAEALRAYGQARELGHSTARLLGTSAISHARLQQTEPALDALSEAVDAGMPAFQITAQTAFRSLENEPRFTEILERAERQSYPCKYSTPDRALDFWVGYWDVWSNGRIVGRNRIRAAHQGCVLIEEYETGPGGYAGTSFNYRDPGSDRWHQLWIDNAGSVARFEGGPTPGGAMALHGERTQSDQSVVQVRMTLSPEGEAVRQFIESYDPEAGTWSTVFDGRYVKRADAPSD